MPFMVGPAPVRRSYEYLKKGNIVFRDNVKIFSVNYNEEGKHHEGTKDFVFWHMCQIQFKNPTVQCITFKNITPSPFIRLFLDTGKSVLIDCDSRSKLEIVKHLENFTAICKHRSELKQLRKNLKENKNKNITQYFGIGCQKHCICEIIGQVPCSSIVKVPDMLKTLERIPKTYKIPPFYMEPDLVEEKKEEE